MKKFYSLICLAYSLSGDIHAQVIHSSYTTQYKEKVLQLSLTIPMDIKDAWKLCTTNEGLKRWIAPVVAIDMKVGGSLKTNYDENKSIGDSTSIRLGIINYLENEMLTLKVNLNNTFPPEVRSGDENLQEIIQFVDAGKGKTKIISSMIGWGQGDKWDQAYDFFVKGNEWTFSEILKLFEK